MNFKLDFDKGHRIKQSVARDMLWSINDLHAIKSFM